MKTPIAITKIFHTDYEFDSTQEFYVGWWIRKGDLHFGLSKHTVKAEAIQRLEEVIEVFQTYPDKVTSFGVAKVRETNKRELLDMCQL